MAELRLQRGPHLILVDAGPAARIAAAMPAPVASMARWSRRTSCADLIKRIRATSGNGSTMLSMALGDPRRLATAAATSCSTRSSDPREK